MKQRHYVHGDQVEGQTSLYYCDFCDLFQGAQHFDAPCSPHLSHEQRYKNTLNTFKTAHSKARWQRPDHAPNLFS